MAKNARRNQSPPKSCSATNGGDDDHPIIKGLTAHTTQQLMAHGRVTAHQLRTSGLQINNIPKLSKPMQLSSY